MTSYAIDLWTTPSLPVVDSQAHFPVRRILCVGRNYADHAIEMGHDPNREPPFFFFKAADCLVPEGGEVAYPPATGDLHHEVELAVAVAKPLSGKVSLSEAETAVFGYGVSLDMTRRDRQAEMKKLSRPWEISKTFPGAAPCAPLTPAAAFTDYGAKTIRLEVNGELRQESTLDKMIWKVPELMVYAAEVFELLPGDLILTGTPAGVAAVNRGDTLEARVEGLSPLSVTLR